MNCLQPRRITKNLDPKKFPDGMLVPCGQCMNCRLQKREEWVTRITHEMSQWEHSMFVTLTYSDEHLLKKENPESLDKTDLQKFLKRLRKNSGMKIKYFACGEYGESNGRCHFHLIIFGMDFMNESHRQLIKDSWPFCEWDMMKKQSIGDVNITSIRYVVSYLEKTILGKWSKHAYENIEKPFHLLSKGMGKEYALSHKEDFLRDGCVHVRGYKKAVPRYYTEITGLPRDSMQSFAEEKECDLVEEITGVNMTIDAAYHVLASDKYLDIEKKVKDMRAQHDRNIKARASISTRRSPRDV